MGALHPLDMKGLGDNTQFAQSHVGELGFEPRRPAPEFILLTQMLGGLSTWTVVDIQ